MKSNRTKLNSKFINTLPGDGALHRDESNPHLAIRDGKRQKTWMWCGWKNGKSVKKKIGIYPDITIAKARELAAAAETTDKRVANIRALTVSDLYSRWSEEKGTARRTRRRNDQWLFANVLNSIRDIYIDKLTVHELSDLKKNNVHRPVALNRALSLLKTMLFYAQKDLQAGIRNVAVLVPRYPETPRKVHLPINDRKAFMEALEAPATPAAAQDIIWLLLYTAARPGEVFSFEVTDFHPELPAMIIPKERAKTGIEMVFNLNDSALEIVLRRIDMAKKNRSRFLFPATRKPAPGRKPGPGHVTSIRKSLIGICRRAGLSEIHPHDLRRTMATWLINDGEPIEVISELLHHGSIETTRRAYAHILNARMQKTSTKIGELLKRGDRQ